MDAPSEDRDPFDRIAEDYAVRVRRGERPSLDEYCALHPELAGDIRRHFPAILMIERVKPDAPADEAPRSAGSGRSIPDRLGDFRILRVVGSGGMGVVYEAERESLRSRVAIKVMHPHYRGRESYLRRFHIEASAAARLHHTNIVGVFDYGEHDGVVFYAMQFIEGQGLDRIIRDIRRVRRVEDAETRPAPPAEDSPGPPEPEPDPLAVTRSLLSGRYEDPSLALGSPAESAPSPPPSTDPGEPAGTSTFGRTPEGRYFREVARIGAQVADALGHAQARGILHRDIKPSNLILDATGNVWVTDFGLAKFEEATGLSTTHEVVGTIRYMAPERFRGVSDRRGDIYALGATLYEMLALRPAFDGADHLGLIRRISEEAPDRPRQVDPRIPRDLETIVLKAMARNPEDRFARAEEMAEELRRFIDHRPIRSRNTPAHERAWRWCRRNPALAILTSAVAGLLAALFVGALIVAYQARLGLIRERRLSRSAEVALGEAKASAALARKLVDDLYTPVAARLEGEERPGADVSQRQILERALAFYEGFVAPAGAGPEARFEAAQAAKRVAFIRGKIGEARDALAAGDRAIALVEPLVAASPDEGRYRWTLAQVLQYQASLFRAAGDHESAVSTCSKALGLLERLGRDNPGDREIEFALLRCRYARGQLAEPAEMPGEATYVEAEALLGKRIAGRRDPEAEHLLAKVRKTLGELRGRRGDRERARGDLLAAAEIWERLIAEERNDHRLRYYLAEVLTALGRMHQLARRPEEALAPLRRALLLLEVLPADHDTALPVASTLAASLHWSSEVRTQVGNLGEAEASLRRSLEVQERLAGPRPGRSPEALLRDRCWADLGVILHNRGKAAESAEMYGRATAHYREILGRDPDDPEVRHLLSEASWGRALPLWSLHRWAEAIEVIEIAADHADRPRRDFFLGRAGVCRALAGDAPGAELAAEDASRFDDADGEVLEDSARAFALASILRPGTSPLREADQVRAVELLRRAERAGHYLSPIRRKGPARNDQLGSLRLRDDFRALLSDLAFPLDPFAP